MSSSSSRRMSSSSSSSSKRSSSYCSSSSSSSSRERVCLTLQTAGWFRFCRCLHIPAVFKRRSTLSDPPTCHLFSCAPPSAPPPAQPTCTEANVMLYQKSLWWCDAAALTVVIMIVLMTRSRAVYIYGPVAV